MPILRVVIRNADFTDRGGGGNPPPPPPPTEDAKTCQAPSPPRASKTGRRDARRGGGTADRQKELLLPPLLRRNEVGKPRLGRPTQQRERRRRIPRRSRGSVAALDRPRRGPSRPRDAGKLQDRLRTWHGRTDKGAAASYFAASVAANHEPAAVLTSPMDRDLNLPNSGRTGTSWCRGSRRKWTVRLWSAKHAVFM